MIFTFNSKVRPNDIVALKTTKYGAKNSIFLGPKLQSHLPQNKTSETNLLTSFRNIMNPHMDLNVDAISLQIFDCFSLQIFHKFYHFTFSSNSVYFTERQNSIILNPKVKNLKVINNIWYDVRE